MRRVVAVLAVLAGLAGTTVGVAEAAPDVAVDGEVGSPRVYTAAELAGTGLEQVVTAARPELPTGKNTLLRVTVRVVGAHRAVTFALAELDPAFGNHPAVFRANRGGVELTVPGDRNGSRTVVGVHEVAVAAAAERAVRVSTGRRSVTLPPAMLARLPRRTVTATFGSDAGEQTHTESGPELSLVLLLVGVVPAPDEAVVAVGSDGYGAAVTSAEETAGGRPLLLSTVEDGKPLALPRLVPLGDVKGGRYVSDVTTLAVS
ncbi:MAG TPA: hypothetical protein VG674_18530 [Amycolatopsis sp.]|jgi:hypothetical protein|nr:hypothetical protein [Amycolatopsis sp.]